MVLYKTALVSRYLEKLYSVAQILEESTLRQERDDTMAHDYVKEICDNFGVCTEESLFYLQGFKWDFDAAMEACRKKNLAIHQR